MIVAAMLVLSAVSTADLEKAESLIGAIVGDSLFAKAEDQKVAAFRRRYLSAVSKVLSGQFRSLEESGLEGDIDEVMAYVERSLGPDVAEKVRPHAERYLKQAFRHGQVVEQAPKELREVWDTPRKEAVDWLVEHDRFWIGKVFPSHLSADFRQTITAGLEEGLGRKDIARRLRAMVMGKPGAPAKLEYYTRIAAANLNRAQNWGTLFTYEAAEIETYTWRAVGDERTCPRCSYFDGQTFSTAPAVSLMRKALAEPPEAIEGLAPWPAEDRERDDFYIKTSKGREYLRGKSAGWLQGHGLGMPPLHASCRCVVVAEVA